MIYVIARDAVRPMGGVRRQYRLAEVLEGLGHDTVVLHGRSGFRCSWFHSQVAVRSWSEVTPTQDDVLVVPEEIAYYYSNFDVCPYVIFNQNPYLFLESTNYDHVAQRAASVLANPRLLGVIVVSESSRQFMSYAFPTIPIQRIRYGIDTKLFRPGRKTITVSYMPRKSNGPLELVLQLLQLRGVLEPGEAVAIDGLSEREVQQLLSETKVFLSGSAEEGFGLPVAEALASCAVVVGYDGEGGREMFRGPFATQVEGGDILSFAIREEMAIQCARFDPAAHDALADAGRAFITSSYPPEGEIADVRRAWSTLTS